MRADRLLKLADFLETVPRKAFDLHGWENSPASKPEGKRPGDCGFAGCAVGWAVHSKLFRGLTFYRSCNTSLPSYKGLHQFAAVNELFGIASGDTHSPLSGSHSLFLEEAYASQRATPKQVAKRIRAFVKQHQAKSTNS